MAKGFRNIDDFVRQAYNSSTQKAPLSVKQGLNQSIGGNGAFITTGLISLTTVLVVGAIFLFATNNETYVNDQTGKSYSEKFYLATNGNQNLSVINQKPETWNATQVNFENVSGTDHHSNNVILEGNGTAELTSLVNDSNSNISSASNVPTFSITSDNQDITENQALVKHQVKMLQARYGQVDDSNNVVNTPEEDTRNEEESTPTNDENLDVFGLTEPEVEVNKKSFKRSSTFLTAESGYNFQTNYFSGTSNSNSDIYEEGTKPSFSFEHGISLTHKTKSAFTFSGGIGLTSFNDNYVYQDYKMNIDTSYYWNETTGTTTEQYDTTYSKLFLYKGNNNLSYANISLGIGTQIDIKKFKIDLFVNGKFNYLISSNGGYIENNQLKNYTRKDDFYRKSFVNLSLGARVHYPVSNHLYLNAAVKFSPVLGELTDNAPFQRKIQYTNAGVGISYFF